VIEDGEKTIEQSEGLARPLRVMKGGVDAHVHAGPFINETTMIWDIFELAREARAAGLRAVVLKSHFGSSCPAAGLANRHSGGALVVGGVTLNWSVGGFNADAVRVAAHEGIHDGFRPGRIVWMPERSSRHRARLLGLPDEERYLSPFRNNDIDAGLTPEAREVCKVIAEEGLVLATSHVSPEEGIALIEEARALGARKFVLTHASNTGVAYTLDQKRRAVELGALIEEAAISWEPAMQLFHYRPVDANAEIIEGIKTIGSEHFILASDCGYSVVPKPTEALRVFVALLLGSGIADEEVKRMVVDNPVALLGLDEVDPRSPVTRDEIGN
jgi:hypothetical protein